MDLMSHVELIEKEKESIVHCPNDDFYYSTLNRSKSQNCKASPFLVFSASLFAIELERVFTILKRPLIVCDEYNYPQLSKKYKAGVVLIDNNQIETANRVLGIKLKRKSKSVIGVGGCTALDIAREVAKGNNLVFFPTIISTKCLTVNRGVLIDKKNQEYRAYSQPPNMAVVCPPDFMNENLEIAKYWSLSGIGDILAEVSAVCDEAVREKLSKNSQTLLKKIPTAAATLIWCQEKKIDFLSKKIIITLACLSHLSSLEIIRNQNPYHRGGEHFVYYALKKIKKAKSLPPHGQIVALAALMTLRGFFEITGRPTLYKKMFCCYENLGIPVSVRAIKEEYNITHALIAKAMRGIRGREEKTILGEYSRRGDFDLFLRTFSEG